jgi:hypothetical protein
MYTPGGDAPGHRAVVSTADTRLSATPLLPSLALAGMRSTIAAFFFFLPLLHYSWCTPRPATRPGELAESLQTLILLTSGYLPNLLSPPQVRLERSEALQVCLFVCFFFNVTITYHC